MSEQSKTPRTDKAEKADRESCEMSREHGEPSAFRSAGYDFARTLECELAGLQAMTCPNCATLALRDEEGAALRARVAALNITLMIMERCGQTHATAPESNKGLYMDMCDTGLSSPISYVILAALARTETAKETK